MVIAPTWRPALVGFPSTAGDVNQFLVKHESLIQYGGSLQASSETGSATYEATYVQWLSEQFVTAVDQTDIGFVQLQLSTFGGSAVTSTIPDLTVSLYTDSFGSPGTSLASVTSSSVYIYGQPFWATIPLAVSGLTPSTTYHLVTKIVGDPTHFYAWQHDTVGSGASTSPDGFIWSTAAYGLMYRIYNLSGGGTSSPKIINEDQGARVSSFSYAPNTGLLTTIDTSTTGVNGAVAYSATVTYNNGLITGVG